MIAQDSTVLFEKDNAPDTVDPSMGLLLPITMSIKIFLVAEQSPLRRTLLTMVKFGDLWIQ